MADYKPPVMVPDNHDTESDLEEQEEQEQEDESKISHTLYCF